MEKPVGLSKELKGIGRRNRMVAALADAVYLAHIQPGGDTDSLLALFRKWTVNFIER